MLFGATDCARAAAHIWICAAASLLVGCGREAAEKPTPHAAGPLVSLEAVAPARFEDRLEGEGTANANESTLLASTVTERVVRLNFEDGAHVDKGDVIAELARGEEAAGLREASARSRDAQQKLDRLTELQRRGFATAASLDAQTAARDTAAALVDVAQAQIGDRVIRAPFSGVLGLRRISVGATVAAGIEIAHVMDLSRIKLDFSLPEIAFGTVRTGDPIEAHAVAYPAEVFRGRIASISPEIDPITRSLDLRAILANDDRRLRRGMLLRVSLGANPRTSLAVPEQVLSMQASQAFFFVVDTDRIARRKRHHRRAAGRQGRGERRPEGRRHHRLGRCRQGQGRRSSTGDRWRCPAADQRGRSLAPCFRTSSSSGRCSRSW